MKVLSMLVGTILSLFLIGTTALVIYAADTGDPKAGKEKYDRLCISCHGKTGKGDGPVAAALPIKLQNHNDGKYMNSLTDKYLSDIIKGGGASMGKSPLMPSWGGQLNDQDIWNLVSYVRTLAVPPYEPTK